MDEDEHPDEDDEVDDIHASNRATAIVASATLAWEAPASSPEADLGRRARAARSTEMNDPYRALVAKVDDFGAKVRAERAGDMRCAPGCAACCEVSLTVCATEAEPIRRALAALPAEARERIALRAAADDEARCVMLEDGRCAVYDARPLVCRTQGLPLAYPPGFVPLDAVRGRDARGHDLTWCPLNFEDRPPRAGDVLDAERVDTMLALVDRRDDGAPGERVSLVELARGDAPARPEPAAAELPPRER
jgi:hypothetical protein